MKRAGIIWLCTVLSAGTAIAAAEGLDGWKTYRSDKFGYELSYPSNMEYVTYFDGSSGELIRTDTGDSLARFEIWPPSKCSVSKEERTVPAARQIGIRRARDLTQADGPGSSSYCGDPLTVHQSESLYGAVIFELELSCMNEEYPFEDDGKTDAERISVTADVEPVITFVGIKGPTYFVDVSQSWLKRVLIADPAGIDPRQAGEKNPEVSTQLRKILERLKTFPVSEPPGICIQDLR